MNYHVELGSKSESAPINKTLNRLRAAAGLIPIIESGLAKSQISQERAALMCEFCAWTLNSLDTDPEDQLTKKLISEISIGLSKLQATLS